LDFPLIAGQNESLHQLEAYLAGSRRGASIPKHHIPTITTEIALRRLERFVAQCEQVKKARRKSTEASNWQSDIKVILAEYYGVNSEVYRQFIKIRFLAGSFYAGQPEGEHTQAFNNGVDRAKGFLESRISDLREESESPVLAGSAIVGGGIRAYEVAEFQKLEKSKAVAESKKIFVVHGHNHEKLDTVARFLTKLGLAPVILHEQTNQGRTIIEKFVAHASEAHCAIILLTADDVGGVKDTKLEGLNRRARQNVIFEFGYFAGMLGRGHAFALVEQGVELPSDLNSLVYIPLDDGLWRMRLVKEMKSMGLEVDANHAL
jgi:predicted nucleotide-binding protein